MCNLRKGELDELNIIVKSALRREGFHHGRQSSDERLFTNRRDGGRGLKIFKELYDETKKKTKKKSRMPHGNVCRQMDKSGMEK